MSKPTTSHTQHQNTTYKSDPNAQAPSHMEERPKRGKLCAQHVDIDGKHCIYKHTQVCFPGRCGIYPIIQRIKNAQKRVANKCFQIPDVKCNEGKCS
jgi:hypothetical protein